MSNIQDAIRKRAREEANYIINNNATIRGTATVFKVSKSTVHRDIQRFLESIDSNLYKNVNKVLSFNGIEKHKRGGEANRQKAKERKKELGGT